MFLLYLFIFSSLFLLIAGMICLLDGHPKRGKSQWQALCDPFFWRGTLVTLTGFAPMFALIKMDGTIALAFIGAFLAIAGALFLLIGCRRADLPSFTSSFCAGVGFTLIGGILILVS